MTTSKLQAMDCKFSGRYITSALEQAQQGKLCWEYEDIPGTIFANFFLTRAGYMHLGYT